MGKAAGEEVIRKRRRMIGEDDPVADFDSGKKEKLPAHDIENLSAFQKFFAVRQHPIRILGYTTKSFWLLLIPLTRSLIAMRFDIAEWLKGRWLDVLIITLIFGYAFLRWVFISFRFETDCIIARQGYFGLMESKILYTQITTIYAQQGAFYRAFGASRIMIDTNSGRGAASDLELTVKSSDFLRLAKIFNYENRAAIKYSYSSGSLYLLVFSLIFSSTFSGVLLLATFFYQAGRIVGNELESRVISEFDALTKSLSLNIPPAALALSLIIIGSWLLSFIVNLVRHWSFTSMRSGTKIVIKSGIIAKRAAILTMNKINYVDLQQNLLTKLCRICTVIVHCAGYGKNRRQIAALIPITTNRQVGASLRLLLPDMHRTKITLRPSPRQMMSYLLLPIVLGAMIPAAAIIVYYFLPDWWEMIQFVCVVTAIPVIWLAVVKAVSIFTTGVGFTNGRATMNYCRLYTYHSVSVPAEKICKLMLTQTWWQKRSKRCNLVVYTISETVNRHVIRQLKLEAVTDLLRENGYAVNAPEQE